jgi:hypothetical protein
MTEIIFVLLLSRDAMRNTSNLAPSILFDELFEVPGFRAPSQSPNLRNPLKKLAISSPSEARKSVGFLQDYSIY